MSAGMTKDTKGFTIVELLMAMAIFSFVMIIIVAAFTQIMKSYRQGVTGQRTQDMAREIIVEMTRIAHESDEIEVVSDGDNEYVCIGTKRYTFNTDAGSLRLGSVPSSDACSAPADQDVDLVRTEDFKVIEFKVEPKMPNTTQLGANVSLTIATNTEDLLTTEDGASQPTCNPSLAGSQFCSVSNIKTAIGLRGE